MLSDLGQTQQQIPSGHETSLPNPVCTSSLNVCRAMVRTLKVPFIYIRNVHCIHSDSCVHDLVALVDVALRVSEFDEDILVVEFVCILGDTNVGGGVLCNGGKYGRAYRVVCVPIGTKSCHVATVAVGACSCSEAGSVVFDNISEVSGPGSFVFAKVRDVSIGLLVALGSGGQLDFGEGRRGVYLKHRFWAYSSEFLEGGPPSASR